jgi:hypothetical protein
MKAMHMIRKGQVRWLAEDEIAEQSALLNACSDLPADGMVKPQPTSRLDSPICNKPSLSNNCRPWVSSKFVCA